LAAVIERSGLKELKSEVIRLSKPLNTDSTMISAIVPTVTPTTEIPEMMLMMLCDFFANRYLRAI